MQERREDRLFESWRASADAGSLAEVYDLTAPTLLRMALHFVREPAAAEDLVQATFLGAIENAASWDGTRPLLGWLVGILHNQARWQLRREGRAPDPQRLPEPVAPDPLAQAQAAEFTARIDAAIDRLPEPYRPVLRLHLKHQFRAGEIAHVLQRPAGTVRKQIVRGLEMLRSALPAGLTLSALALLTPARGLAAVREVVLFGGEAARAKVMLGAAAGTAPWWVAGALAMKKWAAGVLAVLLFTGALLWWHGRPSGVVVADEPGAPASVMAAGSAAVHTAPEDEPLPAPARTPVAGEPVDWRLVGHVRRAVDHAPLPGAVVSAWMDCGFDREPIGEASTDKQGTFTIELESLRRLPPLDLERVTLELHSTAAGCLADDQNGIALPHRDRRLPLVLERDIEMSAGAVVIGRVISADGAPVLDAGVALQLLDAPGRATTRNAQTDAAGRYRIAWPANGRCSLHASHVAFGTADLQVDVLLGSDLGAPDLVLQPAHRIAGRVVFEDGEAAADVAIDLFDEHAGKNAEPAARVITGRDGRFRAATLPPGRYRPWCDQHLDDAITANQRGWPILTTDDAGEASIVLRAVHQIRLHFEDQDGHPLHTPDGSFHVWRAAEAPAMRAVLQGKPLPRELDDRWLVYSTGGEKGPYLLDRGYWLWLVADLGRWHGEALIEAVGPRNAIEIVLRMRNRAPDALLRVVLHTSEGGNVDAIDINLRQLRIGEPAVWDMEAERTERGLLYRVPAGHYVAEVRPKINSPDLAFGSFTPFEQEVDLRAGEETVLERRLAAGGRLRFTVHLPDPNDRRRIDQFIIYEMADGTWAPGMISFATKTDDGGWEIGSHVTADQPTIWDTLLEPGRHTLTVKSRDYADLVIGVTIEPRKITDVDLWLQPR
jgi:RNA polymerase sigma-70 factor (ECF subfamily)